MIMLELKKESVQMLRVKSKATSQVTFDVDYNVPDAKPDVGRMVQSKADVSMDEVRLSEGKAFLKGSLNVDLLYVGEQEGRVYSLSAKLLMDETMNLEGIEGGDKLCLSWEIEDLSIHVIHSRKLNIKAIVTFFASVDELAGLQIPVSLEEADVSVKKKTVRLMSLCVHKKDTLRIKDDMNLASNRPNVENLLWYTIEPRNLDLRPEDDRLRVKGELSVFVMYAGGEEENPPQWLEYSMPFNSEMECSGCGEDLIPHIEVSVLHQGIDVKPDGDGEERVLQAHLRDELQKAQSRHLRGHGHDEQDDGKGGFFEPEIVGVDAVSRQGREIHAEGCRAGRDDQAVADAGAHRDVGVCQHVPEVGDEGLARQQREALLDLKMGAGGVDHQHIEEEQTQKADEHQHQIAPGAACRQCCFFRLRFRSACHIHLPPLAAAFRAAFNSLR